MNSPSESGKLRRRPRTTLPTVPGPGGVLAGCPPTGSVAASAAGRNRSSVTSSKSLRSRDYITTMNGEQPDMRFGTHTAYT